MKFILVILMLVLSVISLKKYSDVMIKIESNILLIFELIKRTFSHFYTHECLKSAAALSFTTILSIVPIVALLFFSVSTFISDSENQSLIHNTLLNFFSPSAGQELLTKLIILAEQASKLRTFGLVALIVTVLLGLNTIDLTINNIWNVERCKRTLVKLVLYLVVLMMIPILITISISVSTYFLSVVTMKVGFIDDFLKFILVNFGPVFVSWLAFVCIYKWVPNIKVPIKYAIVGGVVAAILFELAKILFLIYIRYFPTYDLIYGAFAVLPLFCLWIYISWVIVLAGSVLTYNLTVFPNAWK